MRNAIVQKLLMVVVVVVVLAAGMSEAAHAAGADGTWTQSSGMSSEWVNRSGSLPQPGGKLLADESTSQGSYLAISFADGLVGTADFGLPALSARGLRAIAFVPTAMVGKRNHMPLEDLTALAASGWDVASHLDTGADCTRLPPDELLRRLVASHDWLVDHGFVRGARIFGPPSQRWTPELTPLAVQAGYEAVIVSQELGGIVPLNLDLEIAGCASRRPLNAIAAAIQSAKTYPGTLLLLSFHDIVASNPGQLEADVQRLEQVLDLAMASGLPIVTVSALMDQSEPGSN